MIAVTQMGGHQAIVKKGDILSIDKVEAEVGKTIEFPVLLVSEEDGKNFQVGTPVLEGVTVKAKVLEQYKDEKIRVYKMKPRKRYRRTYGHRTQLTKVEITEIKTGAKAKTTKAPAAKKTTKKVEKSDK